MDSLTKILYKVGGWILCCLAFIALMSTLEYLIGSKSVGENGKNAVYFVIMFVIFRWVARWDLRHLLKEAENRVKFLEEKLKNSDVIIRAKFGMGGQIEPQEEEDCLIEIIEEKNEQD